MHGRIHRGGGGDRESRTPVKSQVTISIPRNSGTKIPGEAIGPFRFSSFLREVRIALFEIL